jgi:hypothetical protein
MHWLIVWQDDAYNNAVLQRTSLQRAKWDHKPEAALNYIIEAEFYLLQALVRPGALSAERLPCRLTSCTFSSCLLPSNALVLGITPLCVQGLQHYCLSALPGSAGVHRAFKRVSRQVSAQSVSQGNVPLQ